ncbi:hypothetical protein WJX72_008991 [[Myrmecia] bisecta]|uniref:Uncharacterized protein n=1 Tax=[Myrmecia] bisecta TaxID=41462 RepID=A0AAW1P3Y0_9CHLO
MTCWLEAIGLTGKVADSTAVLADRGRADVAAKVSLEAIKQGNPLQQVNITAAMVDRGYLAQAVTCSCAFNIIATQDRQLQLLADLTVVTAQRGYLALLAHTNARMVRMKAADVCARASLALLVNMPQHMNTTRDTTWTMVSEGLSAEAQVIAERVVILGVDANQADAIAQSTCCLVAEPSLVEFVATTNIALVRQGHADKCAAVSRAALAQGEVTAMNTIALKLVSMGHMDVAAQIGLSMLA